MDYSLIPNRMKPDSPEQLARVQHKRTCTIDDVIQEMTAEGSAIKESEARANIHEFFMAMAHLLKQGNTISLDYLKARFSLSGIFTDANDQFDPNRHQLNIKLTPGPFLNQLTKKVPLNKVKAQTTTVTINEYHDYRSKTTNEQLTIGGLARIRGANMGIDAQAADQGVFLIDSKGKANKADFVESVNLAELMFQVPGNLEANTYRLEVRAKIRHNKTLLIGRVHGVVLVTD